MRFSKENNFSSKEILCFALAIFLGPHPTLLNNPPTLSLAPSLVTSHVVLARYAA